MDELNKSYHNYINAVEDAKVELFKQMVLPHVKRQAINLKVKGMRGEMGIVWADKVSTWEGTPEQREFMEFFMLLTTEHDLVDGIV